MGTSSQFQMNNPVLQQPGSRCESKPAWGPTIAEHLDEWYKMRARRCLNGIHDDIDIPQASSEHIWKAQLAKFWLSAKNKSCPHRRRLSSSRIDAKTFADRSMECSRARAMRLALLGLLGGSVRACEIASASSSGVLPKYTRSSYSWRKTIRVLTTGIPQEK